MVLGGLSEAELEKFVLRSESEQQRADIYEEYWSGVPEVERPKTKKYNSIRIDPGPYRSTCGITTETENSP